MEILALFLRRHCETESAPGNHQRRAVPMQPRADIQTSATNPNPQALPSPPVRAIPTQRFGEGAGVGLLAASEVFFMIAGDCAR